MGKAPGGVSASVALARALIMASRSSSDSGQAICSQAMQGVICEVMIQAAGALSQIANELRAKPAAIDLILGG